MTWTCEFGYGYADQLKPSDSRVSRFEQQRAERGWDDSELWNLDVTIAAFVLPRLKEYRDTVTGHPPSLDSLDEWEAILDKMLFAFDWVVEAKTSRDYADGDAKCEEGLQLFATYFRSLWN